MPWWKLPRDVLKPPEDRACEMLGSEIALKNVYCTLKLLLVKMVLHQNMKQY